MKMNEPHRLAQSLHLALLCLAPLLFAGCTGEYVLRGRALRGDYSMMQFVDTDGDELQGSALPGARISIWRDPGQLNRKLVASGTSGRDGSFTIRLDAFGAGWMEEQWLVRVVRADYQTVEQMLMLPANDDEHRLLVLLSPGVSLDPPGEDLWDEYERFR